MLLARIKSTDRDWNKKVFLLENNLWADNVIIASPTLRKYFLMHLYLNFMQHKPYPIIPLFHLSCVPGQNVNAHKWISSRFMLRLGFAQSISYERLNLKHRELHKKLLKCTESKMYVTGKCYLSSILLCLTCCELAVYFITLGYRFHLLIKLRLWHKSSLIYKVLYSVKLRRQKFWNPRLLNAFWF